MGVIIRSQMERAEFWPHTPSRVEQLLGVWPVVAGQTRATSEYYVGPRVVPFHSIHVVLAGTVLVRVGHMAERQLGCGDLFCLFPGASAVYRADPSEPPHMMWVSFDGPTAADVAAAVGLSRDSPTLCGGPVEPFLDEAEGLAATFDRRRTLGPAEFLTRVIGLVADTRPDSARPARLDWLRDGRALMDLHYQKAGITVGEIARRVGIDRAHFVKEFTREHAITPSAYLRQLRMHRACSLLGDPVLSVGDVARSVGFADAYTFSHAYRRFFGRPPSADRTSAPRRDASAP